MNGSSPSSVLRPSGNRISDAQAGAVEHRVDQVAAQRVALPESAAATGRTSRRSAAGNDDQISTKSPWLAWLP
ncbi:hypothetical protein NB693_23110 [Pantoea ananatis]|nr:hypothetical protein [Pantoea ananatis]